MCLFETAHRLQHAAVYKQTLHSTTRHTYMQRYIRTAANNQIFELNRIFYIRYNGKVRETFSKRSLHTPTKQKYIFCFFFVKVYYRAAN